MHEWLVRTVTRSARGGDGLLDAGFHRAVLRRRSAAAAENPEIEARMMAVATEVRCLVCHNQTIVVALTALATVLRRRQRMSAEVFDPDTPDEEADDAPR